jgi:cellulose synthase/poly-beta-1,6-N-acetylglucosamine synthase-like glycosyltransferase
MISNKFDLASSRRYFTTVTIIIPAFNEEKVIRKTLESVNKLNYPSEILEVIVVNDGSKDKTKEIVESFINNTTNRHRFRLIDQANGGKAHALNNALGSSESEVVMCLDADSELEPNSLLKAVQYFKNKDLIALAANVKIVKDKGMLNLVQRLEYLTSYEMKKSETLTKIDYIIGGIGSCFRRSGIKEIGYYDTNTLTEDILLSMKIIKHHGNKAKTLVYAADVFVRTGHVPDFKGLVKQRFRWKYGRLQTFYIHRSLFFSRNKEHHKFFSCFILPYALVQEIQFLFEPFILAVMLFISIYYKDPSPFLGAIIFQSFYYIFCIIHSYQLKFWGKIKFVLLSPFLIIFNYIVSLAEYMASLKSLRKVGSIKQSVKNERVTWTSPERKA